MKTFELVELIEFFETKLQSQSKLIKEISDKLDELINKINKK